MLGEKVTIFVGDNGTGKSTLLEAIAYGLDLPLIGGRIGKASPSFEAAKAIRPYLEFQWKREVQKGFFFRAEDFSHFIDDADRERENMHYAGHRMRRDFGQDVNTFSHGEAYLTILQTRIKETDHYRITKRFLDDPENYLRHLK